MKTDCRIWLPLFGALCALHPYVPIVNATYVYFRGDNLISCKGQIIQYLQRFKDGSLARAS